MRPGQQKHNLHAHGGHACNEVVDLLTAAIGMPSHEDSASLAFAVPQGRLCCRMRWVRSVIHHKDGLQFPSCQGHMQISGSAEHRDEAMRLDGLSNPDWQYPLGWSLLMRRIAQPLQSALAFTSLFCDNLPEMQVWHIAMQHALPGDFYQQIKCRAAEHVRLGTPQLYTFCSEEQCCHATDAHQAGTRFKIMQ